jgi:hypothetical protein
MVARTLSFRLFTALALYYGAAMAQLSDTTFHWQHCNRVSFSLGTAIPLGTFAKAEPGLKNGYALTGLSMGLEYHRQVWKGMFGFVQGFYSLNELNTDRVAADQLTLFQETFGVGQQSTAVSTQWQYIGLLAGPGWQWHLLPRLGFRVGAGAGIAALVTPTTERIVYDGALAYGVETNSVPAYGLAYGANMQMSYLRKDRTEFFLGTQFQGSSNETNAMRLRQFGNYSQLIQAASLSTQIMMWSIRIGITTKF